MPDQPLDGDRVEWRNGAFYREGVGITSEEALKAAQEGVRGAAEAMEASGRPEEAMTIPLGRKQKTAALNFPPGLLEYVAGEMPEEVGAVCATREAARAFLWQWREMRTDRLIGLDAAEVEIATPSFFDELAKAWPRTVLLNANDGVQMSYDLVKERHGS